MKILIYLELHPIRDRFDSFGFIGQRFIRMLRDEYQGHLNSGYEPHEVRILLSRHYNELRDNNKDMAPLFLSLTKNENDSIQDLNRDWANDPAAISTWLDVMRGEGEISKFYQDILARVHNEVYHFDSVVNWSTNGAVRRFCEDRGLDMVSMELGCTRLPFYESLYVDAAGVNGNALSRHIDLSQVTPLNLDLIRAMLPTRIGENKGWDCKHNVIFSKSNEFIYKDIKNNVLIPLQLKDDSNCILYSKYKSMLDMLIEVLPQLIAAGYSCFIKPHPSAGDRAINKADHEACLSFVQGLEAGAFWLDDFVKKEDYLALLNKMKYVVTVNSSAGFEAMLCGKIVVCLGDAPYRIGQALPTLDVMVQRQLDFKTYNDNAARIVTVMLRHYLVPEGMGFDFNHFIRYLQRAIRTNDLLISSGPVAMTDYILGDEYLTFDIKERLLAPRELHSRFKKSQQKSVSAVVVNKVHHENLQVARAKPEVNRERHETLPIAREALGERERKIRKFRRDPAKFFIDSTNPISKYLGRILGGQV
jgi:capsular polysaccharide export protein